MDIYAHSKDVDDDTLQVFEEKRERNFFFFLDRNKIVKGRKSEPRLLCQQVECLYSSCCCCCSSSSQQRTRVTSTVASFVLTCWGQPVCLVSKVAWLVSFFIWNFIFSHPSHQRSTEPRRRGESKRNKRNVCITCKVRNADAVDYTADTSPGISI